MSSLTESLQDSQHSSQSIKMLLLSQDWGAWQNAHCLTVIAFLFAFTTKTTLDSDDRIGTAKTLNRFDSESRWLGTQAAMTPNSGKCKCHASQISPVTCCLSTWSPRSGSAYTCSRFQYAVFAQLGVKARAYTNLAASWASHSQSFFGLWREWAGSQANVL